MDTGGDNGIVTSNKVVSNGGGGLYIHDYAENCVMIAFMPIGPAQPETLSWTGRKPATSLGGISATLPGTFGNTNAIIVSYRAS